MSKRLRVQYNGSIMLDKDVKGVVMMIRARTLTRLGYFGSPTLTVRVV